MIFYNFIIFVNGYIPWCFSSKSDKRCSLSFGSLSLLEKPSDFVNSGTLTHLYWLNGNRAVAHLISLNIMTLPEISCKIPKAPFFSPPFGIVY